ncbi:hypothetical protein CDD81_5559 [Ophiocordyceps australis]|uniref:protein-histidine N-methyltransferase n=1 Tax=Ophiocordyceps australis TaxID=1399860 RepID=A0A2C5Y4Q7_9HYPO|nr:hypothetical protein CDD81_5559 [Ophiocordyceps australis]
MAFSFDFTGDDIAASPPYASSPPPRSASPSAFPIPGRPQLSPARHDLAALAARLPPRLSYSELDIALDARDGSTLTPLRLPRRELWDVRVQVMAEDGDDEAALGPLDVKTGVYEGGFKSWESSLDLVKVLRQVAPPELLEQAVRIIELGCGTALPSLALFQAALSRPSARNPIDLVLADYNPSVLELVTLPNLLLAWALHQHSQPHPQAIITAALASPGELELSPPLLNAFYAHLAHSNITLSFLSGAWSSAFVDLVYAHNSSPRSSFTTFVLGSETIYSPVALDAFTETIIDLLHREQTHAATGAQALVAAKRLYFGVGGSLDDFIYKARHLGAQVSWLREETQGIRRGVVRCLIPTSSSNGTPHFSNHDNT